MEQSLNNIYAIILAAGESSRFGSPKQLADWQNGSLLQHTIDLATSLFNKNFFVVLGANAKKIKQTLDEQSVSLLINSNWKKGLSSSIETGLIALPESTQAVMLLLCDQPLLKKSSLKKLIELWQQQPERIVASEYQNSIGVPAIFPASMFSQLKSLSGDKGAKQVLMSNKEQLVTVALPEADMDIDTQEDFEYLKMQTNIYGSNL